MYSFGPSPGDGRILFGGCCPKHSTERMCESDIIGIFGYDSVWLDWGEAIGNARKTEGGNYTALRNTASDGSPGRVG